LSLIIGVALVGSISGDQSYVGKPLALTWPILAAVGIFKSTQSIWRSPLVYWGLALIVTTVFGRWFPSDGSAAILLFTLFVVGGVSIVLWLIFRRNTEPASSKPKSRGGRRPFWIWWWIGALSLIIGVLLPASLSVPQSDLPESLALTWPILAAVGILKSTQSIWRSPLVYWGLALIVTTVFGRRFPSDGSAVIFLFTLFVVGGVSIVLWLIFRRNGDRTPIQVDTGSTGIGLLSPVMKSPLEIPWYRRTRVVALIGSMGVVLLLAAIYVSSQNSSNPLADSQAKGFLLCMNYDALMREVVAGQHSDSSFLMRILDLEQQAKGVDAYIGFRFAMMRDPFAQELSDSSTITQKHNEISVACERYDVNIPRS